MKTKNTNPRPRTKRPLLVYKMDQFTWIAACRRCWFIRAYYSHPLAMKAALSHHSKCLNKATEQTCSYGWIELQSLWSEGEVPLISKTADQLKLGTYFRSPGVETLMYVGAGHQRGLKAVYRSPEMFVSPVPAEKWEVIEECGTFRNPEERQ